MTSKQVYYGLLGIIGLLFVGFLAGAYGVNSLLVTKADTLTALKTKSQALAQEQERFNLAQKDVKKYAGLEQIAKKVVPQDKSQAEAVREIVNIAAAHNITIGSITFPPSTLGTGSSSANPNTSTTASNTSATTPAAAANSAKDKLSQLSPVKGIPGVYQLNITASSNSKNPIHYNQLISFLNDLEHDRRTAQVNVINIQPAHLDRSSLSFTITLNEYIKP